MKVNINKELVERIANNAKLNLTDKEKDRFSNELKEIIDAFSKLDEVDTKDVDISLQPVELKNSLREDKAKECLSQDEALSLTEHKKDGYFKGPRVV